MGRMVVLPLILTEYAGHSPAYIYEAEGFVLKRFSAGFFFGFWGGYEVYL